MKSTSPFSEKADEYDRWYLEEPGSLIYESEIKVLEAIDLKGFGVEIGVGTGIFTSRLNISLGIDPSLEMLKIARKRGIGVIRGVGEALPFRVNCLDYVLYTFSISFMKSFGDSLREVGRVLRKQGHVIVGFISRDSEWGKLYLKKKAEDHILYRYAHFFSLEEVEEMLQKLGFNIVQYSSCLVQSPEGVEVVEDPSDDPKKCGFICIKARKKG